eukprot:TRINITY_DN120_c0_g1_i1.p1 TRINITY_DN120_c0_g1~~TRINITY_DN120_c0_g1_i1.p1  ORF type:complete len:464 (+),score=79.67 TRINITY_DN120_c0_g1_i1:181-1572(+)
MDDEYKQTILSEFMSATNADTDTAETLLQVADWDLEQAVGLFFAQYDNNSQNLPTNGTATKSTQPATASGEIRAPIAQKVERLYEDEPPVIPLRSRGRVQNEVVDAFRDFSYERELRSGGSHVIGSSSSNRGGNGGPNGSVAGGSGPEQVEGNASLAEMYKAPVEITWKGSFESALEAAQGKNRWLLINIQSNQQFASHQLNSDTWSSSIMQDIITNNFIFWQAYSSQSLTQQLMANYNISEQQLPMIIIIDPLTRQKMKDWSGFMSVDKLTEGIVPFMDHSPQDPEAQKLAQSAAQRTIQEESRQQRMPTTPMDEDENLQAAIAASLQGHNTDVLQPIVNELDGGDMDIDEVQEIVAKEKPPEERQQEAQDALPAEPAEDDPLSCRIGFRWPDGGRGQRRFKKSDRVKDLQNYCITQVIAAANGVEFQLQQSIPGSKPLTDENQTIEDAGIVGSMIVMKLLD